MSLQIATSGAGPPLALVHGWGLGRGVWQGVLPALEARFTVHRVSLPGYDGTADSAGDFGALAGMLADALPADAGLCGWSLGGMLALAAAAARPGRFSRLVLVAATPRFLQADDWPAAQPAGDHEAFARAVAAAPAAALARFVNLFNRGDARSRDVIRALAPLRAAGPPPACVLARGLAWLRDVDLRGVVPRVGTPTLVVHGEADPLMPVAVGEWLTRTLPAARLERVAGAAHAPFLSDPARFVTAVTGFCAPP